MSHYDDSQKQTVLVEGKPVLNTDALALLDSEIQNSGIEGGESEVSSDGDSIDTRFQCVDDLDRFLRILTEDRPWASDLYKHIDNSEGVQPEFGWFYSVTPINMAAQENECDGPNAVQFAYQVDVVFPLSDLSEVLERLKTHNQLAQSRRGPKNA